ncbi:hook-related protein family [Phlyctochytrium arcticum]|nr:hook-related protein family [Phlyctochytrium arcticum]
MEEAILQWFSVLGAEPAGIGRISDLADGIILARVLASADPQWFRFQVKSDADDDNWVVRFNRWKKLHKLLFGYYEQVLRLSTTHFETCNITAIAKDRNEDEILKFARLVVALTVQCENNKKFITKMQSLDSDHQHHLMMIIEEVMKLTAVSASPSTDISANHSDGGPFSFHRQSATEPTSNDIGYRRVSTRETHGQIIAQNAMLKDRVKELELQLAHMPEAGQGDSMWRAETDTLRQEIATHEAARVDLEQSIAKHEADSALLNRKIQYAEEQTRELETLRDSVQEVSAMADKLQKAEALVDKYRRRFEETKDLRKLLAASESNVVKLVERNETLEKDASKVPALLQTIEKLKESLDGSRHASESLRSELENMSAQLAETRSFSDQQMSERVRDQDHIHMLEEKLADLEMLKGELHSKRNFEDLPNLAEAKIPTIHPKTPKSPIPDDATSPRDK